MLLSPSSNEIKLKQLKYLQIQGAGLSKTSSKLAMKKLFTRDESSEEQYMLARLHAKNILAFENGHESILHALSFLLLKTVYSKTLNESLLNSIKLALLSDSINLTSISIEQNLSLTNNQMKKIIVQFFFQLCFTDYHGLFQKKISNYPIVLVIMATFIRCILVQFGMKEASHFRNLLSTDTVIQTFSNYFDLNFRKAKNAYLYFDSNLLLYQKNENIVLFGQYTQRRASKNQTHQSSQISNRQEEFFFSKKNSNEKLIKNLDNNFGKTTNIFEIEAPTPNFNQQSNEEYEQGHQSPTFFKNTLSKNRKISFQKNTNSFMQPFFFEKIQHNPSNIYGKNSTPSVISLQQKLMFLKTPTKEDQHLNFTKNNRFQFAEAANQQFFIPPQKSPTQVHRIHYSEQKDEQQQQITCFCRQIKNQNLFLYSKVYSICVSYIQARAPKTFELQPRQKKSYSEFDKCDKKDNFSVYSHQSFTHKKMKTEESSDSQQKISQYSAFSQIPASILNESYSLSNGPTLTIPCFLKTKIKFNYYNR